MCLKLLRTHQPYIIWPNHTWECSQATYWTISYPSTVFTSLTPYQTRDCTETAVRAQTPMPPYVPHYYRYFYLCNDALETLECSYLRDWSHIPTIQPTLTSSNCLCEAVSNSAKKKTLGWMHTYHHAWQKFCTLSLFLCSLIYWYHTPSQRSPCKDVAAQLFTWRSWRFTSAMTVYRGRCSLMQLPGKT